MHVCMCAGVLQCIPTPRTYTYPNVPDEHAHISAHPNNTTPTTQTQALEAQERGEDGPLRVTVDKEEVRSKMADLLKKQDLSRFVL